MRSMISLGLGAAALAAWAAFAPVDMDFTIYEVDGLKHHWRSCADIAIVGDSAVAWTLDPGDLEHELPGFRVVNYGIAATTLSGTYIDTIDRVLDSQSPTRVIVVGFSQAATNRMMSWDQFGEIELHVDRTWQERLRVRLSPRSLCATLFGACPYRWTTRLGRAGLVRNERFPYDADLLAIYADAELQPDATYSTELLAPLFAHVRTWTEHGILVVGFVAPIDPRRAETARSRGITPEPMTAAFVAAGGVLLDLPRTTQTFDGLHMTSAASHDFIVALGRALAPRLAGRTGRPSGPRCPWPR